MSKKNIVFNIMIAVSFTSCNIAGDETTRKRQEKTEEFRQLVSQYCTTSNKVKLSIKDEIIELPCGYSQHIKLFPEMGEADYLNPSYLEGFEPIPISSVQLMVKSSDILKQIWDVTPPIGVVINLYSPSTPKFSQECQLYTDPNRRWCTHYIPIPDTKLSATLRFNGDSTAAFSSYSGKTIVSDDFPYAYYPEAKWSALYEQAETFVKSLRESPL